MCTRQHKPSFRQRHLAWTSTVTAACWLFHVGQKFMFTLCKPSSTLAVWKYWRHGHLAITHQSDRYEFDLAGRNALRPVQVKCCAALLTTWNYSAPVPSPQCTAPQYTADNNCTMKFPSTQTSASDRLLPCSTPHDSMKPTCNNIMQ